MKIPLVLMMAVALTPLAAMSQEAKNGPAPKPAALSGKVIDGGRILIGDKDDWWTVSNPDSLNQHEGERVTVQYRPATGGRTIHVLSVRKAPSELRYTAHWSDAAFRR